MCWRWPIVGAWNSFDWNYSCCCGWFFDIDAIYSCHQCCWMNIFIASRRIASKGLENSKLVNHLHIQLIGKQSHCHYNVGVVDGRIQHTYSQYIKIERQQHTNKRTNTPIGKRKCACECLLARRVFVCGSWGISDFRNIHKCSFTNLIHTLSLESVTKILLLSFWQLSTHSQAMT